MRSEVIDHDSCFGMVLVAPVPLKVHLTEYACHNLRGELGHRAIIRWPFPLQWDRQATPEGITRERSSQQKMDLESLKHERVMYTLQRKSEIVVNSNRSGPFQVKCTPSCRPHQLSRQAGSMSPRWQEND